MKTYSVVIDFSLPDDTPDSIFDGLDNAFINVLSDIDGEVINISDYTELEDN